MIHLLITPAIHVMKFLDFLPEVYTVSCIMCYVQVLGMNLSDINNSII